MRHPPSYLSKLVGGLGWVGLAASCRSRPSGVGFLPRPTTRLNYLTIRFQCRANYQQPPDPTEAQVGGRYRRPVCRRARGQGRGLGLGLARGGQVWWSVVVLWIWLKLWWMIPMGVKYKHTTFEQETQRWRPGTVVASGGPRFPKLQFRAKNSHFWAKIALEPIQHGPTKGNGGYTLCAA